MDADCREVPADVELLCHNWGICNCHQVRQLETPPCVHAHRVHQLPGHGLYPDLVLPVLFRRL